MNVVTLRMLRYFLSEPTISQLPIGKLAAPQVKNSIFTLSFSTTSRNGCSYIRVVAISRSCTHTQERVPLRSPIFKHTLQATSPTR
jgi:hypothetical protein